MKRTCLLVILVAASLGLAQTPPAQKKPLDQIQVLALLAGGVPSPRVAMLVNERGISFEPTEDYLTTLKNAGGENVLLTAVRAAKRVKAAAVSARLAVIMSTDSFNYTGILERVPQTCSRSLQHLVLGPERSRIRVRRQLSATLLLPEI